MPMLAEWQLEMNEYVLGYVMGYRDGQHADRSTYRGTRRYNAGYNCGYDDGICQIKPDYTADDLQLLKEIDDLRK